jgi:hypothetical protein
LDSIDLLLRDAEACLKTADLQVGVGGIRGYRHSCPRLCGLGIQLSYCATSTRNTKSAEAAKMSRVGTPGCVC